SNDSNEETSVPFAGGLFDMSSSMLLILKAEPSQGVATGDNWHATDTIDYVVVISGRIRLQLEEGEVDLNPGDLVVDRGSVHSWQGLGDEPALMIASVVRANPVGAGFQADAPMWKRFGD